jgi:hypothetical protein
LRQRREAPLAETEANEKNHKRSITLCRLLSG